MTSRLKDWLLLTSIFPTALFAATPIDLATSPTRSLSFLSSQLLIEKTDKVGTQHRKHQQYFNGYPVWGAQFINHYSNKTHRALSNGIVYANLAADLPQNAATVLSATQAQTAIKTKAPQAMASAIKPAKAEGIIYIDAKNKAHYAFYLQYFFTNKRPAYIVDAASFNTLETWDNIRTIEEVKAGGLGGNPRVGKLYYDGQSNHLPTFTVQREPLLNTCYLRNAAANLKLRKNFEPVSFPCVSSTANHPGLYWNGHFDYNGGGYSPSNDTYYAATLTTTMIREWFSEPLWADAKGQAQPLLFLMHDSDANASFIPDGYIVIGDALNTTDFYPFTSIDIIAHEMGHAITTQNSDLFYNGASGGINEAFSDMTGKAAEYYARGQLSTWNIGDIMTDTTRWLRYMDHPSQDCPAGNRPGQDCSIETYAQWKDPSLNVHYSSGLFNRFFYLLATTPDWDVKKAYTLMYHANQYYWTNLSNFCQAARGVQLAADNLNVDSKAVLDAFNQVGIDPDTCQ